MTRTEAAKILAVIAGLWSNFKGDEKTVDAWAVAFRNIPYANVEQALMFLFETENRPFAPTANELYQAVKKLHRPVEGDLSPEEAWGVVLQAIRKFGFYRELEAMAALPPVIAAAARAMTWEELCCGENHDALRAHFFRTYEAMRERAVTQRYLPLESNARLEHAGPLVARVLSGLSGEPVQPKLPEPEKPPVRQVKVIPSEED